MVDLSIVFWYVFAYVYQRVCHWPFQEPKLEVPTIYKAYFSGLNFRGYPHNSYALIYIWYVSVPPSIGSWRSPIEYVRPRPWGSKKFQGEKCERPLWGMMSAMVISRKKSRVPRVDLRTVSHCVHIYILVGGFNHLEKYEFVNRTDCPIYYGK